MGRFTLLREFWDFFQSQKKFWIIPIVLLLLLVGLLLIFAQGSVVAPFIYTLF